MQSHLEGKVFMICSNCGQKITKDIKVCPNCLRPIIKEKGLMGIPFLLRLEKMFLSLSMSMRGIFGLIILSILTAIIYAIININVVGWIITFIVIIICAFLQIKLVETSLAKAVVLVILPAVIITGIMFINPKLSDIDGSDSNIKSSIVSKGVKTDDLGNIVNGQFYFDDGVNQFYSTFDEVGESHIYVTNKASGLTKIIFDGFGWSFVMHDGWLYFSGNQGLKIDGTYNLFRMKADGSNLVRLNTNYCYNMNFYKQWLYYIRQSSSTDKTSAVYRSLVDGSEEKEIISGTSGLSIIYDNKLYYLGQDEFIYSANPDGTDIKKIINEKATYFIIGQGKIIYIDSSNSIKRTDVDGSNSLVIKASDINAIQKINSYKNTVFYIEYNPTYLSERRAYAYSIYSIKTDGTNDHKVYDGVSWGYYANMLNDKIFVLDYAEDLLIDKFVAITRHMNLDGSNVTDLYRK